MTPGDIRWQLALQSVARILGGCLRSQDTLARVGGDEFLILLNCEEENFQDIFRKRIKDACTVFNAESDKPFLVEISLGIAEFRPKPDTDTQEIIALADKELYEAKKQSTKSVRRLNLNLLQREVHDLHLSWTSLQLSRTSFSLPRN